MSILLIRSCINGHLKNQSRRCLNINSIFKAFVCIKLPGIFRSQASICKLPPNSFLENEIPMVVYRLTDPIRSKVLIYSKFVSKLIIEQAAANVEESVDCNCGKYHPKFVINTFLLVTCPSLKVINFVTYFIKVLNIENHKQSILISPGAALKKIWTLT